MLNKNKIRWMTRASVLEKYSIKEDMERNSFFVSDYIRYCLLKDFISVSIGFFLIVALYCFCKVEYILGLVAQMSLMPFIKKLFLIYIAVLVVYTAAGIVLYYVRYKASNKRIKKYYRMLKLIEKETQEDKR